MAYDADSRMGHMRYRMLDPETAVIPSMFVAAPFRAKGVSKAMVYAMTMKEDRLQNVGGLLIGTNFQASGLKPFRSITTGECFAAAMRTPFFKAFAHYGFSVITECEYDPLVQVIRINIEKRK